jgi:transposase-like protein
MKLGIQIHVGETSLLNTFYLLDNLDVQSSRKAVHDRVQRTNLQSDGGKAPNRFALDKSVIRINDQQYWLYATVEPDTNRFPIFVFSPRTQPH